MCSVKSYVTVPSTKSYFNEFLFVWVLTHCEIEAINGCECLECHGLPVLCCAYLQEGVLKVVQVTMKHDPFDAM